MSETEVPLKVITDCSTGETVYVPMTAEEIAISEQARIIQDARDAEANAQREAFEALKASAKAKLIAGEPLTEEEANTIVL
jgi:hypothetical protein